MKKLTIILVVIIVIIEGLFMILMKDLEAISGYSIMDMSIQSNEEAYDMLEAYGLDGIEVYHRIQILDFVFPLAYGLLLMVLTKFKRFYLPLLAGLFDYLENIQIFKMLHAYPEDLEIAEITSLFTILKFVLLGISIVSVVVYRVKGRSL